jgi:hypothetical protein
MKQIILKSQDDRNLSRGVCTGRLLMVWGLYGWVVAVFWRSAGNNPWVQAAVWVLALLAALALLIPMLEV